GNGRDEIRASLGELAGLLVEANLVGRRVAPGPGNFAIALQPGMKLSRFFRIAAPFALRDQFFVIGLSLMIRGALQDAARHTRRRTSTGWTALRIALAGANPVWPGLLHHVCELVGEQSPAIARRRRILARTERNVVPHRVGVSINVARRLLGGRTRMHA